MLNAEPTDFKINYGWFHVMRPLILKGLIDEIGVTPWAVYTIIKAYADHRTGRSWPSQVHIGELIGKSPETVARATKTLLKAGLIREEMVGRRKEYIILESAPVSLKDSDLSVGSAEFEYIPKDFAKQLNDLKAFISEGVPPGSGLTLNLTVNLIQQKEGGTVNFQTVNLTQKENVKDELRTLADRLRNLDV